MSSSDSGKESIESDAPSSVPSIDSTDEALIGEALKDDAVTKAMEKMVSCDLQLSSKATPGATPGWSQPPAPTVAQGSNSPQPGPSRSLTEAEDQRKRKFYETDFSIEEIDYMNMMVDERRKRNKTQKGSKVALNNSS
ncbi:uncharacterized protein LOC119085031 isoform X2 [Bradysia coprophila]|nr:uncharacterized protein LOC119085031 isoform X2 [Bradysia coprophila]